MKMSISSKIQLILTLLFILITFITSNIHNDNHTHTTEPYYLPVLNHKLIKHAELVAHKTNTTSNKYIPHNVWIATKNSSDLPKHMLGSEGFVSRNSNWTIHFCDNDMKG